MLLPSEKQSNRNTSKSIRTIQDTESDDRNSDDEETESENDESDDSPADETTTSTKKWSKTKPKTKVQKNKKKKKGKRSTKGKGKTKGGGQGRRGGTGKNSGMENAARKKIGRDNLNTINGWDELSYPFITLFHLCFFSLSSLFYLCFCSVSPLPVSGIVVFRYNMEIWCRFDHLAEPGLICPGTIEYCTFDTFAEIVETEMRNLRQQNPEATVATDFDERAMRHAITVGKAAGLPIKEATGYFCNGCESAANWPRLSYFDGTGRKQALLIKHLSSKHKEEHAIGEKLCFISISSLFLFSFISLSPLFHLCFNNN